MRRIVWAECEDLGPSRLTRKEIKEQANKAYKLINTFFFDNQLPETDIILSNNSYTRSNPDTIAYFDGWDKTIHLCEKYDFTCWDTSDIIENVFHEMIHMYDHLILHKRDYGENDKESYHNEIFLTTALEHGAEFPYPQPDPELGYSEIRLKSENLFKVFDDI